MRPAWDDDIAILSGENVSFAIETAGLGSRFAAAGIDMALQIVLLIATLYVFAFISEGLVAVGAGQVVAVLGTAALYVVIFLIMWGYYFLFEWLNNGQTPGKRLLGLRVVEVTGLPITLWSAFMRNAVRIVDFLPVFYGAGALVGIINPHNRRLGDLAAGTVVARERREASHRTLTVDQAAEAFLESLTAPTATARASQAANPLTGGASAATATLPRLSHEDWDLLSGFLRRRGSMAPISRARLAYGLALRLGTKIGSFPTPGAEEAFLEQLAQTASQHT